MCHTTVKQEVDISTGPHSYTPSELIELCGYLGGSGSVLLVSYPESIIKSIYATIEPFNYEVRLLVYGIIPVMIYALS